MRINRTRNIFLSCIAVMIGLSALSPLLLAQSSKSAQPQHRHSAPAQADGTSPVTQKELAQEIDEKMQRVRQFLKDNNLGGVLINQVRNFSWITAGIADNHIVITSENGASSLLILDNGKKYVLATNSEIPRLMAEDLKTLGYEPKESKWYDDRSLDFARELAAGKALASDVPNGDLKVVDLAPLRFRLTDSEIKKYRWLGKKCTEAVIATIHQVRPGMSERQMEAIASNELMNRGIRPTVLLMGSDERLYKFRHAPPSDKKVEKYAMVNICARKWGLVIAVTRFVHFGPLPADLKQRLQAAAVVNAHYYAATVPGAKAGDIFEQAKSWYADAGFPGEWEKHHQGGSIGYGERDWLAVPNGAQTVQEKQAFAWNPTIMGAKIEDTIIAYADHVENITETAGWPTISATVNGKTYRSPAILVIDNTGKKAAATKP